MTIILAPFEKAVLGLRVSRIWRGLGSAVFVELGDLTPSTMTRREGSPGQPSGEVTIMIEWSWRIEKPRSILLGSWSDESKWASVFSRLEGATVTGFAVFGRIPEIELSLSNGLRVASFMTADGHPEWALFSRKKPKATVTSDDHHPRPS